MLDSNYEILKKKIEIKNFTIAIESLTEQIKAESIDSSHAARAICNLAIDMLRSSTELYQIERFSSAIECEKISR
jgi:hypothetical protein